MERPNMGRSNLPPLEHKYPVEQITDAMQTLYEARGNVQNAIFSYCDKVDNAKFSGFHLAKISWKAAIASSLFYKFLDDHSSFDRKKVCISYGKYKALFFEDIHNFLQTNICSEALKNTSTYPINSKSLTPGWAAILEEYGFFSVFSSPLLGIANTIITSPTLYVDPTSIYSVVNHKSSLVSFSTNGVKCPAKHQVKNHFLSCLGLNIGLIGNNIYCEDKRVPLIEGKNGHYLSKEKMAEIYSTLISEAKKS